MDNRIFFSRENLPQITSVGLFKVDEPWLHHNRIPKFDAIIFVLEGCIYLTEDGVEYTIKKNQIFFSKNGVRRWGSKLIPANSKWFWVCFKPLKSNTTDEIIYLPKIKTSSAPQHMKLMLSSMYKTYQSTQMFRKERLNGKLYEIFFNTLMQANSVNEDKGFVISKKIIEILNRDVDGAFSSETISTELTLNYSYLGRIFKSETGMTIIRYYTELKIQRAITLLQENELNISQISYALNFPNPYYFSKVFKKITGLSPKEYQYQMY